MGKNFSMKGPDLGRNDTLLGTHNITQDKTTDIFTGNQQFDLANNDNRDLTMQERRDNETVKTSVRNTRTKKTIRKTSSPQHGACYSIFKCCMGGQNNRETESRVE